MFSSKSVILLVKTFTCYLSKKKKLVDHSICYFLTTSNKYVIIWLVIVVLMSALFAGTGTYVDMVKAGIIDPLKVIRTALSDAAR